jgi:hypothetical protein
MQVYVRERMMSDTYGRTFVRELAYFDHDLSYWRTLEDTLLSDSVKFSGKLPNWGMVQGGVLSEHRMPELHTSEHEYSLLPTARATGAMNDPMDLTLRMVQDRGYKSRLEEAISLLPTPMADNSRGLPQTGTSYQSLPNVALSLLPTPTVVDMGNNKTPDEWEAWKDTQKAKHRNGNGHGASLTQEAISLLSTSVSTKVQSVDGNVSLDEQHLSLS